MSSALGTMIVGDLMERWPQTVSVFLRHRMSCPGCMMSPFMTVAEAAREYDIEPDELISELSNLIEADTKMKMKP